MRLYLVALLALGEKSRHSRRLPTSVLETKTGRLYCAYREGAPFRNRDGID